MAPLTSDRYNLPPQQEEQASESETPVNLQQFKEFRDFQSQVNQTMSAQEKQYQQQLAAAYQQQRVMQERLEALEDADKDDFGKLENQLKRKEQRIQELEGYVSQIEEAKRRDAERTADLQYIAQKYGIETKDEYNQVAKAKTYDEAVAIAVRLQDKREDSSQAESDRRKQANRPDVGGGRSATPSSRRDMDYEKAIKNRDVREFMRLRGEERNSQRG